MPMYEYKCTVCQERFEVEQSFRDDPLTTLPGGGDHEHQLKKVFSPVGISFRGGGFYRNEARSATKRSEGSSPSESSGTSDNGSSTTKEATSTKESTATTTKASTASGAD